MRQDELMTTFAGVYDLHSGFTDKCSTLLRKAGKARCRCHCDYSFQSAALHIGRYGHPCYEYEPDKDTKVQH